MDTTYKRFNYNELLLNIFGFAKETCLDNNVYGVETSCVICKELFNKCLFNQLEPLLMAAQRETEANLGYALKSRYVSETLLWNGSPTLLQLSLPNVTALNVQQLETYLFDLPISPFILESVATSNPGDGCVVEVPRELADNPYKLLFWTSAGFPIQIDEGRRITKDATNWTIPLVLNPCGAEIDIAHCDYFFIDVPTDECTGTIQPRINDKNLEVYRIDSEVSPNVDRYWFYIWEVVDYSFFSADFSKYEYYKLYDDVSFYCLTEIAVPPVVQFAEKDGCCSPITFDEDADALFELLENRDGVFFIHPTDYCINRCQRKNIFQVTVYYEVGDPTDAEMAALRQMISYYVAAKLPLTSCKCAQESGFVYAAQQPYTETVFFSTGGTKIKPRYGDFYGQLRYRADLLDMEPYRKLLMT